MKRFFSKKHRSTPAPKKHITRAIARTKFLRRVEKYLGAKGVRPERIRHDPTKRIIALGAIRGRVAISDLGKTQARALELPQGSMLDRPFLAFHGEKSRDICAERLDRREVLFAYRVAGKGLRKSPGQGGNYRPSQGPCERRL